ncbi:hypothetical protein [Weissella kandleri]|uniref:hypothetical protein n=1 Tax=Weissella kandleri TaxID=1616 RepID=UPI00387E37DC
MADQRVMLVGVPGLSTTLFMEDLKSTAQQQGHSYEISIVSTDQLADALPEVQPEVVLALPMVAYQWDTINQILDQQDLPGALLDVQEFKHIQQEKLVNLVENLTA